MKKAVLFTILSISIAFGASAQGTKAVIGLRAGVNFSNLSTSGGEAPAFENKTGFNVGIVFDFNVAKDFYIQPGIFYTTRGASYSEYDDYGNFELQLTGNYIQVPVILSYRYPVNDKLKLALEAGPYFAYGIGGKAKADEGDGAYQIDYFGSNENSLGIKKLDAGLRLGAGLYVNKFYVGINYDLGMMKIAEEKFFDYNNAEIKNTNFSISAGMNF